MSPKRAELRRLMEATVADARNWTYRAVRPLPLPESWRPGQRVTSDCSWGVRLLNLWAKCTDPMHNGWSPWGNSSTIAATNRHADRASDLRVGDFVTFGPGGDEHAATVYEPGEDPSLWGDGHQGAPNVVPLSVLKALPLYQGQYQLRFNDLPDDPVVPPSPAEKLKAKTGYWSWLAWKLGGGDWKHYGPHNFLVRPAVPKRIPLAWWKRYATFIKNRKKAH